MDTIRVRASVRFRNDALLRAREAAGKNQRDMAKFCGVPFGVYADLERMDFSEALSEVTTRTLLRHGETVAVALGLEVETIAPLELVTARVGPKDFTAVADVSPKALLHAGTRYAERAALPAGFVAEQAENYGVLESAMRRLTCRQRRVLEMRFGLGGSPPMTLDEVGSVMRVCRDHVRQIEAEAIRKLRHPPVARRLSELLEEPS